MRFTLGRKESRRMTIKCQDYFAGLRTGSLSSKHRKKRLVTKMHTVEYADAHC
jgi:hypothetical protein